MHSSQNANIMTVARYKFLRSSDNNNKYRSHDSTVHACMHAVDMHIPLYDYAYRRVGYTC